MTVLAEQEVMFETVEENFEFENESTDMETPAMETPAWVSVTPAVEAKNNDFLKGVGVGLLAGALAGAVAWLYERKQRLDLLKQIEITTVIAAGMAIGKDVEKYGKKEIDLAKELEISNPDKLIMTVHNNIDKVKMSKKEKKRWKDAMNNLVDLTLVWDKKAKIAKAKVVEEEEVTETLVEQ
jgi:hypothetical protein